MPLEVCKLSRSSRSRICKETDYALPNRGHCASQKMHYYGYKLHAVCSAEGVFQSLDISPTSVHDIHYLKDIKQQIEDCIIFGDKEYLSAEYQLDLFTSLRSCLNLFREKSSEKISNFGLQLKILIIWNSLAKIK